MRATSPAFSFYPKDWLSDGFVKAMSLEARGAYIDLLSFHWLEDGLPNDPARLSKLLGITLKRFTKLWPSLAPCFLVQENSLRQRRLDEEKQKQLARASAQKLNGLKGGRPRKDSGSGNPRLSVGLTQTKAKKTLPSPSSSPSALVSSPSETHPPDGGDGTPVSTSNGNGYKPVSAADLAEAYNEYVAARVSLPAVTLPLSVDRKRKAAMRAKEHPDPKFWSKTFGKLIASKFARGEGDWRGATFDWLIANPTNVCKLAEGNYDDTEHERRR